MSGPRGDSFSRREALARLGALAALPRVAAAFADRDPLEGTIADYAAGLRSARWSAAHSRREASTKISLSRAQLLGFIHGLMA